MIEDPNIQPGSFAPSAVERAQLRLIAQLTRERDALAAECRAMRQRRRAVMANNAAIGSEAIEQTEKDIIEACRAYEAAVEATNALPGMRERLEGT